jgi:hypothetical protein
LYILQLPLSILLVLLFASKGLAGPISVQTFGLVQGIDQEVIIENVNTVYAIGIVGVGLTYDVSDDTSVVMRIGKGTADQSGVNYDGDFREFSLVQYLKQAPEHSVFVELTRHTTDVFAQRVVFSPSNPTLTDFVNNTFTSTDILIGADLQIFNYLKVSLAGGAAIWHMESEVQDQLMLGRYRVTTHREVDTKSTDGILRLGVHATTKHSALNIQATLRSLKSKASQDISGIELNYTYNF